MHVLFLGPLPPPVTGQSLACQVFLDALRRVGTVDVVDHSKADFVAGFSSARRAGEILRYAWEARRGARRADVVYLTISQSIAGNLKDMLFYAAIGRKLSRLIVHLHGGPGMRAIMRGRFGPLNRWVLRRAAAVVILGERHRDIFEGVPTERIHVVANFAEPALFASDGEIEAKLAAPTQLRVLALANFIHGKGQAELVEAYRLLPDALRERVRIDLAGRFDHPAAETEFARMIADLPGVHLHGPVAGERKRSLLAKAHIFSMPSYHRFGEGQPISILEAYASGCAVLTTDHGGIFDVFTPGVNGLEVDKGSAASLARAITMLAGDPVRLATMARTNAAQARALYRVDIFNERLLEIVHAAASGTCLQAPMPPKDDAASF